MTKFNATEHVRENPGIVTYEASSFWNEIHSKEFWSRKSSERQSRRVEIANALKIPNEHRLSRFALYKNVKATTLVVARALEVKAHQYSPGVEVQLSDGTTGIISSIYKDFRLGIQGRRGVFDPHQMNFYPHRNVVTPIPFG